MNTQTGQLSPQTGTETPGEAIRRLLAADERDLAWLSRRTGRSLSHLYRVSVDERPVGKDLAEKLGQVLNVPASTFLKEAA